MRQYSKNIHTHLSACIVIIVMHTYEISQDVFRLWVYVIHIIGSFQGFVNAPFYHSLMHWVVLGVYVSES